MIGPDEIASKAQRLFPKAVTAWLTDDANFFPYRMRANLSTARMSQSDVIREVTVLRQRSKAQVGFGYTINYEQINKRSHGLNDFPASIEIDTLDDLLKLIRKQTEFRILEKACSTLRRRLPELESWLIQKSSRLLEIAGNVDDFICVVEYLRANPRPNCYLRELPIPVSTKLIEQNKPLLREWFDRLLPAEHIECGCDNRDFEQRYGFRYVRKHLLVRLLDPTLQSRLGFPCEEFSLPAEELAKLPLGQAAVIVVENKINLLSFPTGDAFRSAGRPALALGELGNNLAEYAKIDWLRNQPICYWGDLDVEGLQILARFRRIFPQTTSFLMDLDTLQSHQDLWTVGNSNTDVTDPPELEANELAAFHYCREHSIRLEQEHIPQSLVISAANRWTGNI